MTLKTLVLAGATLFSTSALASDWTIDPQHSEADFRVRHMGISYVKGSLGAVSGTVHVDESNPTKSSVLASIDVTQIDTREPKRDGHLKSPDFFDVAKYPTATFKSTKVERAGSGKLKVTGDLTMHGVTRQVVLDVDGPSDPIKDPWGNAKVAATGTTQIDRTNYGLVWNKSLDKGGVLVGNDIDVTISIEAGPKK
jgi:polyisoprenoid-binding protein YceI